MNLPPHVQVTLDDLDNRLRRLTMTRDELLVIFGEPGPAPGADPRERADTSPGAAARTAAPPGRGRRAAGAPHTGNRLRPDIVDAVRLLPEPLQPEAVAQVSGLTPKNARQWLDRATHRGWLTKAGCSQWRRTPQYPPHVLTPAELLSQMHPKEG